MVTRAAPRHARRVDDNPRHAAPIEVQPDGGRPWFVLVDAQTRRLPVGDKTDAVEAGMPHALDYQIGRTGEHVTPIASQLDVRILSLLIGHANVLAFTLIHGPQYYEPRIYAHKIEGNNVPVIDEWWCCGYVKGIALDPEGWHPLIDARPDWFVVIHLYGTKSGWERLKELVEAHEDRVARHQAFVDRIAPATRGIHAYCLAHRTPRERLRQLDKVPDPGPQ